MASGDRRAPGVAAAALTGSLPRSMEYDFFMAEPALQTEIRTTPSRTAAGHRELFRYGSRIVHMPQDDGSVALVEVPLDVDDFLDPEEGDVMVQGNWHEWVVSSLAGMLRRWLQRSPDVAVLSDIKICWGIPELPEPAPDVCVVRGMRDRLRQRGSLDVEEEGVRPCLLIEVVSPLYRHHDYTSKLKIYEQAGVEEYLIVEPKEGEPFGLIGYRLDDGGRYQPIPTDAGGRLSSRTTGLWFSPYPEPDFDRDRYLIVEDSATGERLRTPAEAEARARDAEAEVAQLREKLERLERET